MLGSSILSSVLVCPAHVALMGHALRFEVSHVRWCFSLADNYPRFCSFFHNFVQKMNKLAKTISQEKTHNRLILFAGSLSEAYFQPAAIHFVSANPGQRSSGR